LYKSKCLASRFSDLQVFSAKDKTTRHATPSVWQREKKIEEKDSQKRDANRNKVHERARWNKDVGMVIRAGRREGSIFRPLYQQQVTQELNTKSSGMV